MDATTVMIDTALRYAGMTAFTSAVEWAVWVGLTALVAVPWYLVLRRNK